MYRDPAEPAIKFGCVIINIANDFSFFPSGRTKQDGPNSGERFREGFLIPAIINNKNVIVELDGTLGLASSFLEEAFQNIFNEYDANIELVTSDQSLVLEITKYMMSRRIKNVY